QNLAAAVELIQRLLQPRQQNAQVLVLPKGRQHHAVGEGHGPLLSASSPAPATAMLFRPFSFTTYMALSAARSSSSAVRASSGQVATPKEPVTWTLNPCARRNSHRPMASRSRRATSTAAGLSVSGSSTTNSS